MASKNRKKNVNSDATNNQIRTKIRALNENQQKYMDSIQQNLITFGLGPAGSGRTYVATYIAVQMFLQGKVTKIIISRPIVECGEKLGHLPGMVQEKTDPFMRPILDALEEFLSPEEVSCYIEEKMIEIVPLAYGRGRTFKNCVAILTESQNCTKEQLLMFITRIGENCHIVIEGDPKQSDLKGSANVFKSQIDKIKHIEGIGCVEFHEDDVVRHPIIKEVLKAW